jgi:hypothetical protein
MARGNLKSDTWCGSELVGEGGGDVVIEAKGHNGTVKFDGNFVTISRTGALARMSVGKGDKRIPVASISAVQWKPPGAVMNGFIQFTLGGGNERRSKFGRQTSDAVSDENSVIVTKKQEDSFLALRAAVEDAIVHRGQPQVVVAAAPHASKLDQLKQLGELRDAGVLSEEEFQAEKQRVMSEGDAPQPTTATEPPTASDADDSTLDPDFDDHQSAATEGAPKSHDKAKRVAAAWATGGLSEAARFGAKKFKKEKQ